LEVRELFISSSVKKQLECAAKRSRTKPYFEKGVREKKVTTTVKKEETS